MSGSYRLARRTAAFSLSGITSSGTPRQNDSASTWTTCVGIGGRHASERMDGMDRNQWTARVGIGGRHASESAKGWSPSWKGTSWTCRRSAYRCLRRDDILDEFHFQPAHRSGNGSRRVYARQGYTERQIDHACPRAVVQLPIQTAGHGPVHKKL